MDTHFAGETHFRQMCRQGYLYWRSTEPDFPGAPAGGGFLQAGALRLLAGLEEVFRGDVIDAGWEENIDLAYQRQCITDTKAVPQL